VNWKAHTQPLGLEWSQPWSSKPDKEFLHIHNSLNHYFSGTKQNIRFKPDRWKAHIQPLSLKWHQPWSVTQKLAPMPDKFHIKLVTLSKYYLVGPQKRPPQVPKSFIKMREFWGLVGAFCGEQHFLESSHLKYADSVIICLFRELFS